MDPPSAVSTSQGKPSGIPRLSRLPVPKAAPTVASPAKNFSKSTSASSSRLQSTATTGPRGRTSLSGTQAKASQPTSYKKSPAPKRDGGTFKKPLARPQSRQGTVKSTQSTSNGRNHDTLGSLNGFRSPSRASSRAGSRQGFRPDEEIQLYDERPRPSTSDGPKNGNGRPSLLDRTIESIARVPPTPGTRRRRSSFFSPDSPMGPPPRPGSSLSRPGTSDGNNGGSLRPASPSAFNRSTMSTTRALGAGSTVNTPTKRSLSASVSGKPKSTGVKPVSSQSTAVNARSRAQATNISKTMPARGMKPRPSLNGLFSQSISGSQQAKPVSTPIKSRAPATNSTASPSPKAPGSSSALRDQIRKAKAAHKSPQAQRVRPVDAFPDDVLDYDDPFNQKSKSTKTVMQRKIDAGRTDGRLNIAVMGLKEIPEEVLRMYKYDPESEPANSVAWAEVVDLVRLTAADNELERLPDEMFPDVAPDSDALGDDDSNDRPFCGLEVLDLHGNTMQELPLGLRRLERLTTLNLARNRLTNDSLDIISQVTSLRDLKLAENAFSGELPSSIVQLKQLETLEIQGNALNMLPESFSRLVNLRVLNVASNKFQWLPLITLAELPLVELLASKNNLQKALFPASVSRMEHLQRLDVSVNALTSFGAAVDLPSLQVLDISCNRIAILPNISSWTSLATLLLEDNKMTSLPSGFTSLQSLRNVDVKGNDFSRLDDRIGLMENLESLRIAANPLVEKKFLTMTTDQIKNDLRARLEPPAEHNWGPI